ncbi:GntR family transcriptional regulator [Weissella hellenica]|nr:GntR family transcriptional regulator [Weissella hellenica]
MAKYLEIAHQLSDRINNKEYLAGQNLPDQKNLAAEFKTSRMTIQKAIDVLNFEGLTYSVQGSGTYVKKNAGLVSDFKVRSDQYVGLTQLFGKNHKITSHIIEFYISNPSESEQQALKINHNQAVYKITRLRYIDNDSHALEYTTMPTNVIPDITEKILKSSIYNYIRNDLHLSIGAAFRTISAEKPNDLDQKHLNCKISDPILQIQQTVFLDDGKPFEYSYTRQRFDKGKFVILEPTHPNI